MAGVVVINSTLSPQLPRLTSRPLQLWDVYPHARGLVPLPPPSSSSPETLFRLRCGRVLLCPTGVQEPQNCQGRVCGPLYEGVEGGLSGRQGVLILVSFPDSFMWKGVWERDYVGMAGPILCSVVHFCMLFNFYNFVLRTLL